MAAPNLHRFFSPENYLVARNEVAFMDANGNVLRVDRLVEMTDTVWILDYKSGAASVTTETQLMSYRQQVRAYLVALVPLYPNKSLCGLLIFGDATTEKIEI